MHRLQVTGDWIAARQNNLKTKTHAQVCESLAEEIEDMRYPCETYNKLPTEQKFSVVIKSREEWTRLPALGHPENTICCYTDGSRMMGRTGAAFL